MPINGVINLVVSENAVKKGSVSALMNVMNNSNEEAKKQDIKNGKKVKRGK